jgi:hypothetical protein
VVPAYHSIEFFYDWGDGCTGTFDLLLLLRLDYGDNRFFIIGQQALLGIVFFVDWDFDRTQGDRVTTDTMREFSWQ